MGVLGREGGGDGWGRGQALELTDLEDYIKTTQLSIILQRGEATETCGYVFLKGTFQRMKVFKCSGISFLF